MTTPAPHETDWDFYFCRVDDAPASMTVDLALDALAPIAGASQVYALHLPCQDPGEHGLGSAAEVERLGPLEDAIAERLLAAGLVFVARLRNKGRWQLTFYGTPDLEGAIEKVVREVLAGTDQEYALTGGDDPDWEYFRGFLLPDAERAQWMRDRRVVSALADHDDDLAAPRPVDHYVRFPRGGDVRGFLDAVRERGFSADLPAEDDPDVGISAVREDPVELEHIHGVVMELSQLVQAHGGEYDGWGAPIVRG